MKAVLQRVSKAEITINKTQTRTIGQGLVVLLGVIEGDERAQAEFLAKKVAEIRVFTDEQDKMNLSLSDIGGDMLIVSNFTLAADCKKGRRPSYDRAAAPRDAEELYDYFVECVRETGLVTTICTGEFGADMQIHMTNDGPVTLIIDTEAIGK